MARTVLKAFLVLVFLLGAPAAAPAAAEEGESVFTVRGVAVEVTSESAVAAREQAFANAQTRAFEKLAARLLTPDALRDFEVPEVEVIASMVENFEVEDEEVTPVRYRASYVFRFQADRVRHYMDTRGVSYTETRGDPLLVLPFMQRGAAMQLWEEGNLWYAAWQRAPYRRDSLVPIDVPIGDLEDIQDIVGARAFTYEKDRLREMLARYGAGEAVLLVAAFNEGLTPAHGGEITASPLTVYVYRTDSARPHFVTTLSVEPGTDEKASDLMDRGVAAVSQFLRTDWKKQAAFAPGRQITVAARVRYSDMREWVTIRELLKGLSGVESVGLRGLDAREAQVEISYRGNIRQLAGVLDRAGLASRPLRPDPQRRRQADAALLIMRAPPDRPAPVPRHQAQEFENVAPESGGDAGGSWERPYGGGGFYYR